MQGIAETLLDLALLETIHVDVNAIYTHRGQLFRCPPSSRQLLPLHAERGATYLHSTHRCFQTPF